MLTESTKKRSALVAGFSWTGFVVLLVFGIENFLSAHYVIGMWELGLAGVILVNQLGYYMLRKIELTVVVSTLSVGLALLILYIDGGIGRTGYLWYYVFPVVAFYLLPRKRGYWFFGIEAVITIGLYYSANSLHWMSVAYSGLETRQLVVSYLVVGLLLAFYQRASDEYEQESTKSRIEQQETLEHLSEAKTHAEKANNELKQSQRAMFNLLEDERVLEIALKREKEGIERQIAERTDELLAIIESVSAGILVLGEDNETIFCNHILLNWLQVDESDKVDLEMVAKRYKQIADLRQLVIKGRESKSEVVIEPKSWGTRYIALRVVPVIREGRVNEVVIFFRDRTEEVVMARSRDEFFSIASHELRTPLTAIMGNTALIEQYYTEELNNPDLKEMIGDIRESATRLIGIVNDFLNTSRLEMNKIDFKTDKIDLSKLVADVVSEIEAGKSLGSNEVSIESPKEKIEVIGDSDRIKEVLINLIGNANKFTPKGSIRVITTQDSEWGVVHVIDQGIGIAVDKQALLFRKFQQAGNSLYTRDTTKGTGLGLYISKLLMVGMKGEIKLNKSIEGKGSDFEFRLPLARLTN